MKSNLKKISSKTEFYQQLRVNNEANSHTICVKNCNIQNLDFSMADLKKVILLEDNKDYNIRFENCTFKKFRYTEKNENISFTFISCSSSELTIVKSNLNSLTIKDNGKYKSNRHKHVEIQKSNIANEINLESPQKNQKTINISKTSTPSLLIKEYNASKIRVEIVSIKNLVINKTSTKILRLDSSALSTNSIFIEDASQIELLKAKSCNFDKTEILGLNLSKFHFPRSDISGIRLAKIRSESDPDRLSSIAPLALFFTIFSLSPNYLWLVSFFLFFGFFYLLPRHKKIYSTENKNPEELADIYRSYKAVFLSQGNIFWYNEMLYSEQLHTLKKQKIFSNFYNIKFYNYLFNGFGRRWRRALIWVFTSLTLNTIFINKVENYELLEKPPKFLINLFEADDQYGSLKIDIIHSLSKLDILKTQSSKWFISTDFSSYLISSLSTLFLMFFIGSFILAFKRRLDQ